VKTAVAAGCGLSSRAYTHRHRHSDIARALDASDEIEILPRAKGEFREFSPEIKASNLTKR
jgi:hypothetical protein